MNRPARQSVKQPANHAKQQPASKPGKSLLPLFIVGGVVLVALIVVIAVLVVKKIGNAGLDILRKEAIMSEESADVNPDDYEISVHENAGNDTAGSEVYDAAESDYSSEIVEDSTNEESGKGISKRSVHLCVRCGYDRK